MLRFPLKIIIKPWCEMMEMILQNTCFNAVGVALFRRNPPYIHVCIGINHTMKHIFQRRRYCVFDSPGLPNDSAGYPGLTYGLRGPTP